MNFINIGIGFLFLVSLSLFWPSNVDAKRNLKRPLRDQDFEFSQKSVQRFLAKDCPLNITGRKLILENVDDIDERVLDRIINLYFHPAENTLSQKDYVQSVSLNYNRVLAGQKFIRRNRKVLQLAYRKFGVPPEYVSAIIGVESLYGKIQGKFRVFDALTILGFNRRVNKDKPQMATYFRKELCLFTQAIVNKKLNIDELLGSYAGAMGMPQFMPSAYFKYGQDGNNDRIIDIWEDEADVIFSVANYLKKNGFKKKNPGPSIWEYNHSDAYVEGVIALAKSLRKND